MFCKCMTNVFHPVRDLNGTISLPLSFACVAPVETKKKNTHQINVFRLEWMPKTNTTKSNQPNDQHNDPVAPVGNETFVKFSDPTAWALWLTKRRTSSRRSKSDFEFTLNTKSPISGIVCRWIFDVFCPLSFSSFHPGFIALLGRVSRSGGPKAHSKLPCRSWNGWVNLIVVVTRDPT